MARWDHKRWVVAAHPVLAGCVLTVGLSPEGRRTARGAVYRGFRVDAGDGPVAFGNAFVDAGRIAIRLEAPIAGASRFDFEADADGRAVPGTGRVMLAGGWEPLPTLGG